MAGEDESTVAALSTTLPACGATTPLDEGATALLLLLLSALSTAAGT